MERTVISQDQLLEMIRDGRVSPEAGIRLLKTLRITGKADIDTPGPIYCRNVWKRKDAGIPPAHGDSSGHGLLFDDTESLLEELTDRYRGPSSGGGRLILVKPGETFKQIDDRTYIIHPDAPDDYRKLLAALKDRDIIVSCILHLWSKAAYTADPTLLTAALEKGFYSLFHLSKSLAATKPKDPIQLVYVYSNPPETCQPQYAALSGFAKTIILETSKLIIKTVGLSDFDQVPDLFDDMVFSQDGIAAEYRGEERWIQQVEEIDPPAEIGPQLPFKEKGVYVLTGGAGGLGMLLAEYLAERVRARLVLVGRSPLDREKTERIDALEAMGSEVLYIRGDVTRREDMEAVIDQTKARFNAVNGIVHAAGLIRDAYFYNKSVKDAGSVLAPKVFGTVYLDEATKTEPIDFFCMFSSITSVFGNAGQSDYAFANGFLDGFAKLREMRRAEKRRFGKTLSINWPLWQSGGMQVDPETKTYLSKSFGMELLDSKTGLDVFSRALNIDSSQVAVVSGDPARLRKTLSIKQTHDQTDDQTYGRVSSELSNTTTDMALVKSLRNDLKVLVSDTIRVDVAEVDSDEEIHALGFDSISLTELANQINDRYRVGITPAIFFEHPTVNRLIDYLRHAYPKEISVYFKIESKPAAESPGKEPIPKRGFHPRIKPRGKAEDGGGARREIFAKNDPVAIIGMAGVMPQSTDLNRFWHHLETGQDLITEVPADRWNWRDWYGDPREAGNQTLSKWGGFMTEVDKFDCLFFGISPKEAELMDPQQRIFLEITWKTIEDAGYKPSDLAGSRTGLFVGVASRDYMDVVREYVTEIEPHAATGMSHSVLANRISYLLDLNGPSEPIDTACSSSLVAIHRAIEAIQSGTCEMAIAGGVNVMLTPTLTIGFDKAGMLSPDGRCKTFDQAANGYVRGEGAGAILLKPLNRAISDEDHIHAVIRSTAENHGGRSASLTAPNPKAQAQLLVDAYEKADIEPDTVGYIETHGTGTHLGDPVEINGLIKAFKELYARSGKDMPKKPNCGLGTVKSNIGHLETAAGIAGVIKTILSLKNRKLPASLHFKTLNPYIQLAGSPFYVVSETKAWEPPTGADGTLLPRRAGVSSFGFGGANAHVVLEEYVDEVRGKRLGVRGGNSELKAQSSKLKVEPQLIVLSAKNEERLRDYAKRMAEFLESAFSFEPSAFNLSDIAYTLQVGREPMEWRLALVSDSIDGISEKLTRYAGGDHEIEDFHVGRAGPKEEAAFDPVQNGKGNGSLVDMAKRWVSGMDVDWETLHFGSNPHRVSLPTYPFERERHWVGDPEIPAPVEPMGEISGPLQEKTENHLKGVLAEILKLATTKIDTHARMEIYGLDSIMINRFNQKMESLLGPLPRTLLFEHQTLRDLATYLVRHHGQELIGFFGLSNATTRPAPMRHGVKPKKSIRPLVKKPHTADNEGIAIIGVSGRYPLSRSLEEFWQNLKSGRDCIREIPKNRWDFQDFYDPDPRKANEGKAYCKWGGFLDDADKFDPLFFNIAPKEAETMDPQERLFLETAWETLEDAGYSISRLNGAGSDVGVFVGVTTNTYLLLNSGTPGRMPKSLPWSIANRVSYTFDFQGPSLPVDTACSASLYAIHLACESLSKGECGFALAGGVNLYLHPSKYIQLCQTRMLSPNGRCHSFGAGGDGFVPGEGVGAVLLRPLSQAIEHADRIYAVIKGSAVNHGGKTNGYTVPNPNAQVALIEKASKKAGVDPRTITYIEAHGTGTSLGDPVEIRGLTNAYRNHTADSQYCSIGSVKSNIGHLESAAGIAGLTKILLQMKHGKLVPSLHAETTNPNIRFEETPFFVQQELSEWKSFESFPRRAGLSSFGAGGANAHLILEEYQESAFSVHPPASPEREQWRAGGSAFSVGPQLIVLSAKNEERLKAYARAMVDYIESMPKEEDIPDRASSIEHPVSSIEDIAYTLQVGREAMEVRLAMVVSGIEELREKLSNFIDDRPNSDDFYHGNIQSYQTPENLFIEGEAGEAYLKVVFDNRDLGKLARLWISGVEIDWNRLQGEQPVQPLSLPTYPFEKKRYWISKMPDPGLHAEQSLHPLIDKIDPGLSLDDGVVFTKIIQKTDLIVRDHQLFRCPVMPGCGFMEMAYAAGLILKKGRPYKLAHMVWRRPLAIERDEKEVQLMVKEKQNRLYCEIHSREGDRDITFATLELHPKSEPQEGASQMISIDEIRQRCPQHIDKETLFNRFRQGGIIYEEYYQGVTEIFRNSDEALGRLQLPAAYEHELQAYTFHPTVTDAALQTIAGITVFSDTPDQQSKVSCAIEEADVFHPIPSSGYTYVKAAGKDRFHAAVLDETGRVCLKLKGVAIRALPDPLQHFFYMPYWIQAPLSSMPPSGNEPVDETKNILTIYPAAVSEIGSALASLYPKDTVKEIRLGKESRRLSERIWEVDTADPLALDQAVGEIGTLDRIYFLGGIESEPPDIDDLGRLARSQEFGVLTLFRLVKSLIGHDLIENRLILSVITNDVHQVLPEDRIRPYSGGIPGLTMVTARELKHLSVSCVDISLAGINEPNRDTFRQLLSPIVEDLGEQDRLSEVAIRNGTRYVRTLEPIRLPPVDDAPFKEQGIYLILGGAGGIGMQLSRYLSATFKARLILIGRRSKDEKLCSQVEEISRLGGKALYIQADATDTESMLAAVETGKSSFGTINGVIHSAIVLKDKAIFNMDEDTFRAALSPKVGGSMVLHSVIRNEPLDFFMFFSSAQSYIVNAGQSNYAAACTFEDAFARFLSQNKPYPVKVINWGYWGSIGVVASEDYNRRLSAFGVGSIEPEEGLEAIRRILIHPVMQIMPFKADNRFLEEVGIHRHYDLELSPKRLPSMLSQTVARIKPVPVDSEAVLRFGHAFYEMTRFARYMLLSSFQTMGVLRGGGEVYTTDGLIEQLNIIPGYNRLFHALLHILLDSGWISMESETITAAAALDAPEVKDQVRQLNQRREEIEKTLPDVAAHVRLLWRCLQHYPDILTGRRKPTEILFPHGSKGEVETIYKGNVSVDFFNDLLAQIVRSYFMIRLPFLVEGEKIKILEVGAGTGGTSAAVLKEIEGLGEKADYLYTDISQSFVRFGQERFSRRYPFTAFGRLDIESDPTVQGYATGSCDMVIATNVLHATRNIRQTLQNVKRVLKGHGILLLNETTEVIDFATLTFGLTEGWWTYEDEAIRLPDSPLLSPEKWHRVLEEEGFERVVPVNRSGSSEDSSSQHVIAAESNGVVRHKRTGAPFKAEVKAVTADEASREPVVGTVIDSRKPEPSPRRIGPIIEAIVSESLAKTLGLDGKQIDRRKQFSEYGVDSIMGIELIDSLGEIFRIPLKTTIIFDYANVADLSNYLCSEYGPEIASVLSSGENPMLPEMRDPEARSDTGYDAVDEIFNTGQAEKSDSTGVPASGKDERPAADAEGRHVPANNIAGATRKIAIIGMSGRFPGAADLDGFWQNLARGRNCVTEAPKERWDSALYYDPDPSRTDKTYCKWGGFLSDIDRFDPLFFNMSGKEAEETDPQQRLFLQACWSALEDAGYPSRSVSNGRCGVFAGVAPGDYGAMLETPSLLGNSTSVLVSRISYLLNLKGPSVAVDTACSSSLVAVHLGCQSILTGECDMVLAGGVFINTTPVFHIVTSNGGMLSPTGKCRTFDDTADGFVPGEGVGVVVLKSLSRAVADGDHIYGVIQGSGINQDGKTNGITAPSARSQTELELSVYRRSGINPESISYVEAHGTGTKLGDPVEIEALTHAFSQYTDRREFCGIGSVKTNMGHASYASGVAGLIKVLLAIRHRQLPPSLNFHTPNRHIDFKDSPFYVNTRLRNWETEADWPRRAAVSSFGYSGTNAHLVVEEYKGSGFRVQGSGFSAEPQLIVLSARNEDRLKAYVEILEEFLTSTLNSERLTLNLSDVTYTLQVGRDEMEYRLALVVSSLEELKGRLGRFAGGQTDIPDLFSGNIETGTETGWGSPDEADGKEKAEKLLLERDLRKIAESWVAGGVFDWNCLYPNHTPRRIPLPTYPFARERYWVPSKEERKPLSVERPDRLPALHPLIDSNESTLAEQCFKKTLSGDAFYLKDHVVGGASVLPGVIYLEMARAAGALSMENSSVKRLRNIVWATPIRVDVSSKETYIRLWPGEKGVEYEISTDNQTQNRTEDRIIHSRGNLDFGDPDPEPDHPEAVDAIRNRLAGHQTRKDFYRRFESYGFNYGPSFRIVEEIHHNDAEALSVLVLPESLRSAAGAFMLHPSLMDGALQTVAGLMGDRGEERVYLPYAMRELALIRPLTDRCCAHVLLKESFGDSAISKFDIDILNESGESLIRIKDFSIRGVEMKHQNTDTDTGIGYFRLNWKSSPQADAAYASDRGPVLLFDMDASRSGAVAKRLGAETILVLPGTKFEIKNRNTLVINPGDPDQYRQLMSRLTEEGRVPNRFIHLWSQGSFDADKNRLSTQIDMGLNSIFHLTQTLMERKPTTARHLLYIYHEPEQAIQPQYAAVSGFVKTVRLENPNLIFKTIGISDLAAVPDIVQTEFHSTDGTEIRYENRRRYVRDFSSHEAESVTESLNYLKEQGVYIITGGAGGIGLTLSDYLCGKGNIHLFLSGRSPLNQKVSEKIETLKKSGSRVEYIRADVSNPADTGRLVSRIVSEHGRIDGIFHAAGILRDGLIFGTKGEDLASVLAPKVWGTLHLDNATKTEPLDFFVMFSSATAVMGNIGQSGYAFANGFMDHFAKWRETMRRMSRRSGRTLSVNWPLWEDGGMGMDESSRKWMIDKTGMVPLSAEKGLRALDHALQTDLEQLMVFNGDNEKIRQVWTYSNQIRSERHASETPTIGPMGAPLQNNAEAYLKEFLAEEIRLPVSKIRTTDPFEKYGIDSVMVMNLTRKLETGFGELSKTLFFEYRNISELAAYFINRHRAKLIEHLKESRSAPIEINDGVQSASKDIMAPKRDRFVRATDRYSSPPSPTEKNDIAIVGLSGRYPMAGNLNEFWENLKTGKDCISEIPRSRWDYHPLFDPDRNKTKEGKIYTKWGGFMDDVDKFDTLFFHISPKEAKLIDPQERLFLETVWHTLEDAGYTRKGVDDRSVGVFVGVMWGEYQLFGAEEALKGNMIAPRSSYASISNRVSYVFNFTGPSITLDTMCSSSLTAIHLACESIRKGESGLAVAGGVNVSIHMQKYLHLSQGVFASSDGRCRSFGEGGDGYVPGEGVGAVLLKPLKDAVRDGDHIYGVIRGTAINHGGKTNGYTVPNPNAQAGLIAEAIRSADIDPRSISYLEAHGTGTALGDPIEITGLMKAFGDDLKEKQFCAIGSVKSNIGHLESAAGIAGLTKVLLQMKHRQLVPSLHSKQLNPNIKFENSPFYVQRELGEWKQPVLDQGGVERPVPRRAGISSFGAGGANAHLVLEEFQEPEPKAQSSKLKVEPQLIVLSAKNEDRLRECAKRLAEFVESAFSIEPSAFSLTDIAYTLQVGREAMDYRLAIPVHGMEDMKEKLEQYLNGADKTGCVYQGHTGPDQIGLDGMMEGEEGKQFIDSLMNNRKLDRLAQLWGSGANVDWRRLHAGRTPKRLPLPTYPFAKERYWVSTVPLPFFQKAGRLHPFIDSIDMKQSVRQGMTFQKRFANSDRILTDHCVNGTSILPGVGIAEMIHAAGSMIGDTGTGRLSRLIWQRPVTVDQDPIDVTVVVTEKDDHYACLVRSRQGFESITHATAAFHPEPAAPEPSAGPISLTDIKGRCFQEMDAEAFYRRYDEYGIGYGDYLRGVRHIWGNDEESLARIQLPEQFQSEFEDYTLHPGLADAGLQAIAGITSVSDTWDRSMMVPYAVEEIEIIQPLKSSGYAYVKRSGKRQFDVCLTDENGNICVAFKDLAVKALPDPYADFFYVPRWQYAPLETGVHTRPLSPGKRKVLIIHPTACFGLEMALAELHALDEVYAVRLGRETRQISEKQWEAGIDDPYALGRTVEAVGSVHQIYFLGGIQPLSIDCDDPKMLAQSQDSGLRSLFRFIKAMTKQDRVQIKPKLTIVTNDVYRIGLEDVALPLSGGLGGLAKVIDIEYRELGVDCIDISLAGLPENPEPETLASLIMPVFREAEQKKPAMDVAVRDGRRYVRVLEPIRLPAYQSTPFRNKGVYFIVGGAGGIGFELSLHLARTVKARLIWIGRRAIDEQIEAKIEKVDTLGGSVRYISADAANLESMKEALESAKSCFGAINGVIHSAIVLKDKALFNMEEDALNAVLAPKVAGSLVLHNLFRKEPLDFMMFFSSAQTFFASAGQGNYAAASTFEDAYADYIRTQVDYPVKVINWGYWGSIGIVSDERYLKRLSAQGIGSIEPKEGMEAIARILTHRVSPVIPFKASKDLLKKMGLNREAPLEVFPVTLPSGLQNRLPDIQIPPIDSRSMERFGQGFARVNRFSRYLLMDAFNRMHLFQKSGEAYDREGLKRDLNILPGYHRLYDVLVYLLSDAGWIREDHGRLITTEAVDENDFKKEIGSLEDQKDDLMRTYPELGPYTHLLWVCLKAYPDILRGERSATDVLFPDSSMALVEEIYKGNANADYFNHIVVQFVRWYVEDRLPKLSPTDKINMIEVGAGTGGTSALILDAIHAYGDRVHYAYTDVSQSFINHGKKRFGSRYSFMDFKKLDVETDVASQGFAPGSFDLILAANVIHATRNIQHTLRTIKPLLKTNGCLILNEATAVVDFTTLTFGLLEGWWLFEDEDVRIPGSPLVAPRMWRHVLAAEGFRHPLNLKPDNDAMGASQHILVAESDGVVRLKDPGTRSVRPAGPERAVAKAEAPEKAEESVPAPGTRKPMDIKQYVEKTIEACVAEALDLGDRPIESDKPFSDFGVDSIIGIDVINKINDAFGIVLKTIAIYDYSNVKRLSEYIIEAHKEKIARVLIAETVDDRLPPVAEGADPDPSAEDMMTLLNRLARKEISLEEAYGELEL